MRAIDRLREETGSGWTTFEVTQGAVTITSVRYTDLIRYLREKLCISAMDWRYVFLFICQQREKHSRIVTFAFNAVFKEDQRQKFLFKGTKNRAREVINELYAEARMLGVWPETLLDELYIPATTVLWLIKLIKEGSLYDHDGKFEKFRISIPSASNQDRKVA